MKKLIQVIALLGLVGCGGAATPLESGTFQSSSMMEGTALQGSTLELDVDGGTGRINLTDGGAVDFTLSEVDPSDWETGCHGNFGGSTMETWAIQPAPLEVAGISIASPRLSSGCFPEERQANISGTVDGADARFIYEVPAR